MAILPNAAYTLIDVAKQADDEGRSLALVDLLSQDNEILLDLPWIMANSGTQHKTSVTTGLPSAFWRQYNAGVPSSKATKAVLTETCAMLEVYSFIDRDLYRLNGEDADWRLMEERAFISGISQQMASALFYNNQTTNPSTFTGLAPRYNSRDPNVNPTAANVIDGGGRGSTNTSIWFCTWGPDTGHGIYPKGSNAGLQVEDVSTTAPVDDGTGTGSKLRAVQTHYKWDCGMAIRDWRQFVRIGNIDTTALTTAQATNIIASMVAAVNKLPATQSASAVQSNNNSVVPVTGRKVVGYINRTVRTALELQVMNKSNTLLQLEEYDGIKVLTFRGIPLRTCDALLNTEAAI